MARGKLKMWDGDRGFGFIAPDEDGPDVFVHVSAFQRASLDIPDVGDRVSYDLETNSRTGKLAAVNLKAA